MLDDEEVTELAIEELAEQESIERRNYFFCLCDTWVHDSDLHAHAASCDELRSYVRDTHDGY